MHVWRAALDGVLAQVRRIRDDSRPASLLSYRLRDQVPSPVDGKFLPRLNDEY